MCDILLRTNFNRLFCSARLYLLSISKFSWTLTFSTALAPKWYTKIWQNNRNRKLEIFTATTKAKFGNHLIHIRLSKRKSIGRGSDPEIQAGRQADRQTDSQTAMVDDVWSWDGDGGRQGRPSPPETMMHFPPCFRFPPIFEKFSDSRKLFTILPIPEKFLDFHPPKFLITFSFYFSHRPQISNFPLFSLFQYISPLFRENYYFHPTLKNFSPCFRKIHLLFTCFMCISFPPTLTMMHLCITQCTYCTPLIRSQAAR